MALKLMYITNRPEIARIAENAGVDRIFVDMEYIGKALRQGGMDTVQSRHTVEHIRALRPHVVNSELLVRINPIHDACCEYGSSEEEINVVVESGADVIMLPFFKTAGEIKRFLSAVDGRAKTMLLIETPEAVEIIDSIFALQGIDEVHIGINDLSLGYHKKFMFELLADGSVEKICDKCKQYAIPYGFGGIASIGKGLLPTEYVIMEHYRLGSQIAILSRSFCNTEKVSDMDTIHSTFIDGVRSIRQYERYCEEHPEQWEENRKEAAHLIGQIAANM